MNSKYEKERRQQFSMFAAEQRARDAGQIRHSKAVFDNKTNLITQEAWYEWPVLGFAASR